MPAGYQQVEYLQSTGTQGIDTGVIIPDNYFRIECKLKCTVYINGNTATRFWGSQGNGRTSIVPWYAGHGAGPFATLAVAASWYLHTNIETYVDTIYTVDLTASNGQFTGTCCGAAINTTYSGSVATGRTEGLFFNNQQSTPYEAATTNQGASAFYYCRMHTSEGLVRDFVPCYRKSDNKPGMYDLVTKTFFTNIGTGEFTVGDRQ